MTQERYSEKLEELLLLQRLIFFTQRPPPENIRSFNIALIYNNAYIKDFLVEIRKKNDHVVEQIENEVPKDNHQRYLNNGHHTAAIDTFTSKCMKNLSRQAPIILALVVHHTYSIHCM